MCEPEKRVDQRHRLTVEGLLIPFLFTEAERVTVDVVLRENVVAFQLIERFDFFLLRMYVGILLSSPPTLSTSPPLFVSHTQFSCISTF